MEEEETLYIPICIYIYICCLKSVSVLPCEQLEDWDSRREMDVEAGS